MRPVARVRWNAGPHSAAGLGDARAAALRERFEQLLHGSGQGVSGVSPALSSHGTPPPSSGHSAGLDALIEQPQAMQWAAAASTQAASNQVEATPAPATVQDKVQPGPRHLAPMPVGDAPDRPQSPRGTARQAELARSSDAAPAATAPLRAVEPPAQAALASPLVPSSPVPQLLSPPPIAATPSPDATVLERATQTGASRAPDNAEPAAVLPPLPAATTSRAEMQAQPQPQPPAPQSQPASGERHGLPELVRDLVQAVVHLSRGREGQWRLTMALKPQVLNGTLVALEAEPGRLQVRFDCAGAEACTRLAAVRDDLRLRLAEALSAARAVEVRVDVQLQTQAAAHDGV
jgi:Type III secretion protein (HpaP)